MKHCKKNQNYKISIYKYNQKVKGDLTNYWIDKYNIDNINEIDNIDKLNLKNLKYSNITDFNDVIGFNRHTYDGDDLENINIISRGDIDYDILQVRIVQNTRLVIKLSECELFCIGNSNEINKIPELFFKKRNLLIVKNLKNDKCLLWCFVKRFLNPVKNNSSRITKKDIEICKELMVEHDIDFENVSLDEIDKIEDLLECKIHIFGDDKKLNSKKLLENLLRIMIKI